MSDAFSEAISTDESPAPEPSRARNPLLGDPSTEGNEHLLDGVDVDGPDPVDDEGHELDDDLHAELNNSDVQN